jgi:hypothetical protein
LHSPSKGGTRVHLAPLPPPCKSICPSAPNTFRNPCPGGKSLPCPQTPPALQGGVGPASQPHAGWRRARPSELPPPARGGGGSRGDKQGEREGKWMCRFAGEPARSSFRRIVERQNAPSVMLLISTAFAGPAGPNSAEKGTQTR